MNTIKLPETYNYIGVFLTLGCNLTCSYCINHTVGLSPKRKHLNASEWIESLNKISEVRDVPISLQGGEPTLHPGFRDIINNVSHGVDLLTNLQFDIDIFMKEVKPERFDRNLPYPSIRVSYHPETMRFDELLPKAEVLTREGYSIGIFVVEHPTYKEEIKRAQDICGEKEVFFKKKELLAELDGNIYGLYKYPGSCFSADLKTCMCKTSELLVAPDGNVFRCHHDLYNEKMPVGNISSPNFQIEDKFRECTYFGQCNPCDVKIKNNRYQEHGHCSVTIKDIV